MIITSYWHSKNTQILKDGIWNFLKLKMGKSTVKGATQVIEHSLKLHFCMFQRSQMKYIVWIVIMFLGIFSVNCKIYMLKVWHKSKMFLHVQSTQTSKMDNPHFFQMYFFLPTVHHFFWKLERILTLMIRKEKGLELMNFFFINHSNTFGSKVFLTLKIMDFENVPLTKIVHYLCDQRHECIIYMI